MPCYKSQARFRTSKNIFLQTLVARIFCFYLRLQRQQFLPTEAVLYYDAGIKVSRVQSIMIVCVCVRACVRACGRVCVRVCVCVLYRNQALGVASFAGRLGGMLAPFMTELVSIRRNETTH